MLRQILAITWKDLKIFFTDPGSVALIFLMPFMFIVVMSYALAGLFGRDDAQIQVLAVNQDQGSRALAVLQQLDALDAFQVETTWEGQPLNREMAERLIAQKKRSLALVFPSDFSAALEQSSAAERQTAQILAIVDPATSNQFIEPILGTLQGLIERQTFAAMIPSGMDYLFEQLAPQCPLSSARDSRLKHRKRRWRALQDGTNRLPYWCGRRRRGCA